MGNNVRSVFLCREEEVAWEAYIDSPWRSARARELDQLGGLDRAPIKRGDSMTARLELLQLSLAKQSQDMEAALYKSPPQKPDKQRQPVGGKYLLRTDIRALEREQDATNTRDSTDPPAPLPLSWAEQQERDRQAKAAARGKMLEYAKKAQNEVQQGIQSSPGKSAKPSKYIASSRESSLSSGGQTQEEQLPSDPVAAPTPQQVAAWRKRVHGARRRAILTVLTIVRLKQGRNHPARLQRVDSFSYCIPLALNTDYPRFVEEQARHLAISVDVQGCKEALEEVLQTAFLQGMQRASGLTPSLTSKAAAQQTRATTGSSPARALRMTIRSKSDPSASHGDLSPLASPSRSGTVQAGSRLSWQSSGGRVRDGNGSGLGLPFAGGSSAFSSSLLAVEEGVVSSEPSMTSVVVDGPRAALTGRMSADAHLGGSGGGGGAGAGGSVGTNGAAGRPGQLMGRSSASATVGAGANAVRGLRDGAGPDRPRLSVGPWAFSKRSNLPSLPPPSKVVDMLAFGFKSRSGSARLANGSGPASAGVPAALGNGHVTMPPLNGEQSVGDKTVEPGGVSFSFPSPADAKQGAPDSPQMGWHPAAAGSGARGDDWRAGLPLPPTSQGQGQRKGVSATAGGAIGTVSGLARSSAASAAGAVGAAAPEEWLNDSRALSGELRNRASSDSGMEQASGGKASLPDMRLLGMNDASADLDVVPEVMAHLSSPVSGLSVHSTERERERSGAGPMVRNSRKLTATEALAERSKVDGLAQRLEQETSRLTRSELMLGMYVNRANSAWAERQDSWLPPRAAEQEELNDGLDLHTFKAEALKRLRGGQVVFQFFACDDELSLPSGGSLDLWTSDPWALVAAARPGTIPLTGERLEGLSLGGRALTQLRMGVEAAAGAEAAEALTVVLHIHDGQKEAVLADLCNRRHYGLRPDNVFVTVQQRRPGYMFDPSQNQFVPLEPSDASRVFSLGPGYAMMQLGWVADAFVVTEAGKTAPLQDSLLEHFKKRNVEWMVSRRACDLSMYSAAGALDLSSLAQTLQLRHHTRATVVAEVTATTNLTTSRHLDSVFLSPKEAAGEAMLVSPFKKTKFIQPVHELRCCEAASAAMVDALGDIRAQTGGEVLAGLHRYAFHLPSLAASLGNVNVFRPKLKLEGSAVRITLEVSDLTSAPRAKCMALHTASSQPTMLLSAKEAQELVPIAQAQDCVQEFRDVAGGTMVAAARIATATLSPSATLATTTPARVAAGHRVVVFCADNDVTHTAVEFAACFARSGRDEVFLCTVVPSQAHMGTGSQLLSRFAKQLSRNMIKSRSDVMVKGYMGLLECMESYVVSVDASLVVMGSQAIVSQPLCPSGIVSAQAVVGSVTLSCMKRLRLPMAIVTPQTRLHASAAQAQARLRAPRALAIVEPHSRPMLDYLCTHCLDPLRGDRLYLGQPTPARWQTSQKQTVARRVMNDFVAAAGDHRLPVVKLALEGQLDKAVCQYAESEGLQLVALHLKMGDKTLPPDVVGLIRSCKAAVLLYRDILQ